MKLTRRDLLAGAAALSATSVLPFAIGSAGAATKSLLKFIPQADLKILDPIWTTAYITRNHGYMVYDTLFAHGREVQAAAADGRQVERAPTS